MKTKIKKFIAILFVFAFAGCQENEHMVFSDVARIVILGENVENTIRSTFIDKEADRVRDTLYITVNTMGYLSDQPRNVKFIQIPEIEVEYIKDENGNTIDSVVTEVPFQAIPGVHYIPLDDSEAEQLSVVAPKRNSARIGFIFLRDKSLLTQEYTLFVKLVENEFFQLGAKDKLTSKFVISNKLLRPSDLLWNRARGWFGVYSDKKHRFMNSIFMTNINDKWLEEAMNTIANMQFLQDMLTEELRMYNEDPENIKNGLSPMREIDGDPTSPIIKFGMK